MRKETGGGQILLSIGIVVVLGALGLSSNFAARSAAKHAARSEAAQARFYLGEIANLHGLFRERRGADPLNAAVGGTHPVSLPASLPAGLNTLTASSYNSTSYSRGTALNVKATLAFDPSGLVSSFYTGGNLSYRPRAGIANQPFCSDFMFHSRSMAEGVCLTDIPVGNFVNTLGPGAEPRVQTFTYTNALRNFVPFSANFRGGVRGAVGDLDRDGFLDVAVGPGPGGGPDLKAYSGRDNSRIFKVWAYTTTTDLSQYYTGGVNVAVGDIDGDGWEEIIAGPGSGHSPFVRIFNGLTGTQVQAFYAYDPNFTGGVRVATGDVNNDGIKEIITAAGPGGGSHVRVFDGRTGIVVPGTAYDFFAYPGFFGGVFVASGDINRDGHDDIITGAGAGGGPHVRIFSTIDPNPAGGVTELMGFMAYDPYFPGGVSVGSMDYNQDGYADIITGAGPGGGPHVRILNGRNANPLQEFMFLDPTFDGGVFVGGYNP